MINRCLSVFFSFFFVIAIIADPHTRYHASATSHHPSHDSHTDSDDDSSPTKASTSKSLLNKIVRVTWVMTKLATSAFVLYYTHENNTGSFAKVGQEGKIFFTGLSTIKNEINLMGRLSGLAKIPQSDLFNISAALTALIVCADTISPLLQ